jgi:DnaK suppressor protein
MDELTPAQREELHADLLALAEELRRSLDTSEEGARPVQLSEPIGRISRMDAIQQQSMAKANRQAAQLRLQQVEAALHRVSRHEYGVCLGCEEGVGFGRLKARPEALLCITCQSERENRH